MSGSVTYFPNSILTAAWINKGSEYNGFVTSSKPSVTLPAVVSWFSCVHTTTQGSDVSPSRFVSFDATALVGWTKVMSSNKNSSREPLKLHMVRISPDSRTVWLYLLQVRRGQSNGNTEAIMKHYIAQSKRLAQQMRRPWAWSARSEKQTQSKIYLNFDHDCCFPPCLFSWCEVFLNYYDRLKIDRPKLYESLKRYNFLSPMKLFDLLCVLTLWCLGWTWINSNFKMFILFCSTISRWKWRTWIYCKANTRNRNSWQWTLTKRFQFWLMGQRICLEGRYLCSIFEQ